MDCFSLEIPGDLLILTAHSSLIPLQPLHTVHTLLDTWCLGLHSWFGRSNILKMCVLPKFLYLFQALPIDIPMRYFKQANALFTCFIWAHISLRIRRSLLTLPKHIWGGIAAPDLHKYYQAAHMGHLLDWCWYGDIKLWPNLEQAQSQLLLSISPWCFSALPLLKRHPLIGPTT